MTTHDKRIALARWIHSVLAESQPLPETVQNFMDATFGTTDLATIVEADATGEVDSLLELLFFPDMPIQIRFESQWGNEIFTSQDLTAIQALVCQTPVWATITQPAGAAAVTIEVQAFALKSFVQRLNITWQPDPQLPAALARHWPGMMGTRVRVHLRNARLAWHADQVQLMHRILTNMPWDADDAEVCITFLLTILTELVPETDPFDFLVAKKFFYFQSLCKAEDFERKRHTSNMEIMMLQGNRAAHGNMVQWRQQMQWIDRICHTVFGRTHFFQQPGEPCVEIQSGNSTQMMDDLIRTLS
jgi:hypothetical protein